ncbi:hypothetical protein [uncultured Tenacibaculum sp.]|uniref:helix-turn-helix transcriptional regulator n=1 Tax=uncultured Tenacibaculum sp. TaxID=174713 RepID=UPI0026371D33|nr:hypothetical protein [uncultured Tenacibaculum sp.]
MSKIKKDILLLTLLFSFLNAKAYQSKRISFISDISVHDLNIFQKFKNYTITSIFDFKPVKKKKDMITSVVNDDSKNKIFSEDNHNLDLRILKVRQKFRYLLIVFIVVCSLLTSLLIIIISKLRSNNTQIKNLEIKEKATLQNHIKQKEEEILATVIAVSAQQEELIQTLKVIENLKDEKHNQNLQEVYNKLKNIIQSSSNLNLIFQKLESQYTYFSTTIKNIHPNLTKNDIRNCILLRLGFSLKDSAELLNVSVHAIKIARQRIKKKINYNDNISLKEYLDTFQNYQSFPKKI